MMMVELAKDFEKRGMKAYEEWSAFHQLTESMDDAVDKMFLFMNLDDVKFMEYYDFWFECKEKILKNRYNQCGHKLCKEIREYEMELNHNMLMNHLKAQFN